MKSQLHVLSAALCPVLWPLWPQQLVLTLNPVKESGRKKSRWRSAPPVNLNSKFTEIYKERRSYHPTWTVKNQPTKTLLTFGSSCCLDPQLPSGSPACRWSESSGSVNPADIKPLIHRTIWTDYRPVSNLPFISSVTGKPVQQLLSVWFPWLPQHWNRPSQRVQWLPCKHRAGSGSDHVTEPTGELGRTLQSRTLLVPVWTGSGSGLVPVWFQNWGFSVSTGNF